MNKKTLLLSASVALFSTSALASISDFRLRDADDTGMSSMDGVTNLDQPTFIGEVNPDSTLEIRLDGNEFSVDINPDGHFEWMTPMRLPDGEYDVEVIEYTNSDDGFDYERYSVERFIIDTWNELYATLTVDGESLVIRGIGEPESYIEVEISKRVYRTTVAQDGKWELTVVDTGDFTDGYITVTSCDIAGNESSLVLEYLPEEVPHLHASLSDASDSGRLDDGITNQVSNFEFEGSATPFSMVTLNLGGSSESVNVGADGKFVLESNAFLPDGLHQWTVMAETKGGQRKVLEDTLIVDTMIDGLDNIQSTGISDTGTAVISGVASEPMDIKVTVNNKEYRTYTSDSNSWSVTVTDLNSEHPYPMMVLAYDVAGNVAFLSETLLPSNQ